MSLLSVIMHVLSQASINFISFCVLKVMAILTTLIFATLILETGLYFADARRFGNLKRDDLVQILQIIALSLIAIGYTLGTEFPYRCFSIEGLRLVELQTFFIFVGVYTLDQFLSKAMMQQPYRYHRTSTRKSFSRFG